MQRTQDRPWWQNGVVYQIYPRSFQDTTASGIGDLDGITRRLDYLADTLSVDAIWISPFYPSPMADFGYDVADYTDVDPMFGDLAAFDRLLAAAHERGLRVIIDWVPNHTSDRHRWFQASQSSRTDPKRDWYVWRDPAADGGPPSNWLSVFGGPAWEWHEATGQYYLHSFLREQPDLDWRNPEVEEAMFATVRFWLERGVDGIRIDVAHYIMKDPELRDNPAPAPAANADDSGDFFKEMGPYDSQDHRYDKGHGDVHAVYRRLRRLLDGFDGDRFAVGEIHEPDWERWAAYYGPELDELHMPFNFSLLWAPWEAAEFADRIAAQEAALPTGAWPNHVLGNHDETRLATRYGPESTRAAAVLLLTLRGTPTLYYGDELGFEEAAIPPELMQDPWGRNVPGLGRDGCRTPMLWSDDDLAGFSAGPACWLPLPHDAERRNVAAALADEGSLLNLYRRLLRLRRAHPALHAGDWQPLAVDDDDVLAYLRTHGPERFLVAVNFGDAPTTVALPGLGAGPVVLSTHAGGREHFEGRLPLAAHGAALVCLDPPPQTSLGR